MQAPFQLTKSRKLYNDSMWKKEEVEVIPPYKIVVVRTCILKFLHSDPPVVKDPLACLYNNLILRAGLYYEPRSCPKAI